MPGLKARLIGTALILAGPFSCQYSRTSTADQLASCRVERISDGDSFYCEGGTRVRLTGIDTPELDQGALGRRSRDELRRLIPEGSDLRLEVDVQPVDRYGRTLAYAWRANLMINREMVRRGWAMLYTVPPNVKYAESLRAAEDSARSDRTGHWAAQGFDCLPVRHRKGEC